MSETVAVAAIGIPLSERIHAMYRRDCVWAGLFVCALWATIFFVNLSMRPYMSTGVEVVCWIASGILLLFNTASIVAMIRHYAEDKEHIYGTDIRHLDAGR